MKSVPVIMTRINPLSSFMFTANCADISAIGPKELRVSLHLVTPQDAESA